MTTSLSSDVIKKNLFSRFFALTTRVRIFFFFTPQTGVDAARFAATSRRARRLVADDSLWRELFRRRFRFEVPPDCAPPSDAGGWRGVYRHHQTTLDRIVRGEAADAAARLGGGGDAFWRSGRVGAVHVFHGGALLVSS